MAEGGGERAPTNITHHLKGMSFPARRDDLVGQAEENGADEPVLAQIREMPDREYGTMADVMRGIGESG